MSKIKVGVGANQLNTINELLESIGIEALQPNEKGIVTLELNDKVVMNLASLARLAPKGGARKNVQKFGKYLEAFGLKVQR